MVVPEDNFKNTIRECLKMLRERYTDYKYTVFENKTCVACVIAKF